MFSINWSKTYKKNIFPGCMQPFKWTRTSQYLLLLWNVTKGKIETLAIVAVKADNQRYFVKPTSGKTGRTFYRLFVSVQIFLSFLCQRYIITVMRDVTLKTHELLFEKRTIAVETKSSLQEVGSIKVSLFILTLLDKILMEKSSIFFKPHLRILIPLMTPLFRNKLIYRDSSIITMTTWKKSN